MQNEFKKIKDHNNKTGNGRKKFKYFNEMNEILGNRAVISPPCLLESQVHVTNEVENQMNLESETGGLQESDLFNAGENYKEDDDKLDCERNKDTPSSTPAADQTTSSISVENHDLNDLNSTDSFSPFSPLPTTSFSPASASSSTGGSESKPKTTPIVRKRKKSSFENATTEILSMFIKYQEKAEEKFLLHEEKRRKEEMAHEEKLMSTILTAVQGPPPIPPMSYYLSNQPY